MFPAFPHNSPAVIAIIKSISIVPGTSFTKYLRFKLKIFFLSRKISTSYVFADIVSQRHLSLCYFCLLRPELFYYLVLGRFFTKPRVGGGKKNENKWPKPVCRRNESKVIVQIFIFWRPLGSSMIIYFLCDFYEKENTWYKEHFVTEWMVLSIHFCFYLATAWLYTFKVIVNQIKSFWLLFLQLNSCIQTVILFPFRHKNVVGGKK